MNNNNVENFQHLQFVDDCFAAIANALGRRG
jgi:hypothetical protein